MIAEDGAAADAAIAAGAPPPQPDPAGFTKRRDREGYIADIVASQKAIEYGDTYEVVPGCSRSPL